MPDLLFVIDTNKEDIAIKEARRLNIPVAAIVDTNCDPNGITFAVPGNDDASRAITLYCDLIARAAIDGISRAQGERGVDIGAADKADRGTMPTVPAAGDLGFEPLPGPRGVADDLKKLPGVSPAIEKQLNDLGIFHYWQIAELNDKAAHNIGEEVGLARPRRRLGRQGQGTDGGVIAAVSSGRRWPNSAATDEGSSSMANITAQMVKELRESDRRGHDGLQVGAHRDQRRHARRRIDWLRKKGLSKAAKKAGRVAAEGLIGVCTGTGKGVVVEVNSETDFVARNDLFQGLVKMIADVALGVGTDVDKIKAAKVGSITVAEVDRRHDRQDRREHDAAPRRRAVGRQGRDRHLHAQFGDRRSRQDRRAGRARIDRQGRRTDGARPPGRDAYRGRQSAGGRCRPASIRRRRHAREGRARRQVQASRASRTT